MYFAERPSFTPELARTQGVDVAPKNFVGFGLGPIMSGLMLHEARRSGNYGAYTVAEVDQELVDAIRGNGNRLTINVAGATGIASHTLENLVVLNPTVPADRERLVEAIGQADELATAVPAVKLYTAGGENSIVALLAQGSTRRGRSSCTRARTTTTPPKCCTKSSRSATRTNAWSACRFSTR